MTFEKGAKGRAIKSGIRIQEKPVRPDVGFCHVCHHTLHCCNNIVRVMMLPAFRGGHDDGLAFSICKIKGIGRLASFPSLIADFLSSTYGRSVAAVKIHT